jgi:hypothetical protein
MRLAELLERFGYPVAPADNRSGQDEVLVVDIRGSLPPRHFVEQKLQLAANVNISQREID